MSIDFSQEETQQPLLSTAHLGEDEGELSLRPRKLTEYIGQEKAKENLSIFIDAAKLRGEPLDHVLLHGPPGLGKTTLSGIIANEMGVNLRVTSGPAIEKPGDLAALLTNLSENDILFVDEIHRLNRSVEEILYPAMEDFAIDIIIGKGPSANSIRLDLPHFTLIGATTRAGQLSAPLRDRFGVLLRLELYTPAELAQIVTRSAGILGVPIEDAGAAEIAKRARGTPRIANRLLRRVRDFAADKLLELDDQFHEMLFAIANKMQTYHLMNSFTVHDDRIRSMALYAVKDLKSVEDHRLIAQALADHDAAEAKRLMDKHLSRYKVEEQALRQRYPNYFK